MSRPATIASLSFRADAAETVADALAAAEQRIDVVAGARPDLLALPEAFIHSCRQCRRSPNGVFDFAEPLDGPTVSRMAERARQHRCYIAAPLIRLGDDGERYNSIVMLDRRGEIVAVYDKLYPTAPEMAVGSAVMPGDRPVIADTDFGRVGLAICFDLNFDDLRRQYLEVGVELLVFCSMFHGGLLTRARAALNRCYLVSSISGDGSRVVDPLGRVLNECYVQEGGTLVQRIDLDYLVLHVACNVRVLDELMRRYGERIDLSVHSREAAMLLTCRDPALSVEEIRREVDLEEFSELLGRSVAARRRRIDGGPTPPPRPEW
jgi:predicted amidohydrolase